MRVFLSCSFAFLFHVEILRRRLIITRLVTISKYCQSPSVFSVMSFVFVAAAAVVCTVSYSSCLWLHTTQHLGFTLVGALVHVPRTSM